MASSNNNQKCYRCDGTGIYRWGTVVNGVSTHQGTCWRCNGNGVEPSAVEQKVAKVESRNATHGAQLDTLNKIAARIERTAKNGDRLDVIRVKQQLRAYMALDAEHALYAPSVYAHLAESVEKVERMRFA